MTTTAIAVKGSTLVPPALFDRLVSRIEKDHLVDHELATRIMDQALAFLGTCAVNEGAPLAPSGNVDLGWHAFVLHTHEYAWFCEKVAGYFIHHVPEDEEPGEDAVEQAHAVLNRTAEAIRDAGYIVDAELWLCQAKCIGTKCKPGSCTSCHDQPHPGR